LIPYVDGFEMLTYEVIADLTALEAQAIKAAANRKGQSRDGAVIVNITRREPCK
jgi:O-acetyl-ADP-ribose deacetylase (regulator of RNase III)